MSFITLIASSLIAVSAMAANKFVYHDYDIPLGPIHYSNACVTATEVHSINDVRQCALLEPVTRTEYGEGGATTVTDWVCKRWETAHVVRPRAFERPVCEIYDQPGENYQGCLKVGVKADFLPQTIKISTVTEYGETSDWPGVQSTHTFPNCQ